MPFLSKMFEPEPQDHSGTGQVGSSEGSSDSGDVTQSSEADADAEVTLSIRTETSVEYETHDEAGGWSNVSDVTLTVSADALLGAVTEGSYENEAESS